MYSYDTLGNLKKKGALTLSYKSNKPHQIDRVNGVTYQYDTMGNLLADDRHTFAYDPLDKVTSITQDGQTTTFDYNENGQRYLKITDNGAAFTHYSGKLYENYGDNYTTANRVEKNFIYFGNRLIAIKQRDVTIAPKAPTILYPYHDNLGNVIALLDETFQIKERRSYTPFGTIRHIPYKEQLDPNKIPTLIERLKNTNRAYTGHESIEGTDIIHMNGRVYDTITARFTSADPHITAAYNLQSYNRYSYVINNPLNYTDPTGYDFWNNPGGWFDRKHNDVKNWASDNPGTARWVGGGLLIYGGMTLAASPSAVMGAPLIAAAGVALIRTGVDLLNGEFDKVSFEITAPVNFGSEVVTPESSIIAETQMYDSDITTNYKYMNGGVSESFAWIYAPQPVNNAEINIQKVLDMLGKVWALPNTTIGLVWGGTGYVAGKVAYGLGLSDNNPELDSKNNAIVFLNHPFMAPSTAITLGNTMSYHYKINPKTGGSYNNPHVQFGRHEERHTYQQQKLGIFFFPIWLFNGAVNGGVKLGSLADC